MESEIFGHLKGTFTGASADRKGAASQADGGTLFLNEICEMDLDLQKNDSVLSKRVNLKKWARIKKKENASHNSLLRPKWFYAIILDPVMFANLKM